MPAAPRAPFPRDALWVLGAAVPLHVGLALGTDLSPDEAYYLCAARSPGLVPRMVDHPPLLPWLLRLSDQLPLLPVELRVRVWPILFALALGLVCVELARRRGASPEGCMLAAWVTGWSLLPTAGGFVATPDGPALLAMAILLFVSNPTQAAPRTWIAGALAGIAGTLAKVIVVPLGLLVALTASAPRAVRILWALAPLSVLWLAAPSLSFQLRHAYGQQGDQPWSVTLALAALGAAVGGQFLLWSPWVLLRGFRGLKALARADQAVFAAVTLLFLASALTRAFPPEPNWWAPAALVAALAAAVATPPGSDVSHWAPPAAGDPQGRRPNAWRSAPGWRRRALVATVLVPTALAVVHTLRPVLPLPAAVDPTARLHGWSTGHEPLEAAGVGPYGPAAERCVYRGNCDEIMFYFDVMNPIIQQ